MRRRFGRHHRDEAAAVSPAGQDRPRALPGSRAATTGWRRPSAIGPAIRRRGRRAARPAGRPRQRRPGPPGRQDAGPGETRQRRDGLSSHFQVPWPQACEMRGRTTTDVVERPRPTRPQPPAPLRVSCKRAPGCCSSVGFFRNASRWRLVAVAVWRPVTTTKQFGPGCETMRKRMACRIATCPGGSAAPTRQTRGRNVIRDTDGRRCSWHRNTRIASAG